MRDLSVCIPTRRRPQLLKATLEHLSSISDGELEVVVSDNCSGDETRDVVESFRGSFSALRFHVQDADRGAMRNAHTALSMASRPFSYALSDDDRLIAAGIRAALAAARNDPQIHAVYGGHQEWDPKTDSVLLTSPLVSAPEIYGADEKQDIFLKFGLLWCPLLRTEIYQRHCFIDETTFGFWRLIGQIMRHGKVAVIPDIVYKHAHTIPRLEYDLTESWYHDKYRADFELFCAELDLDANPENAGFFAQFVATRVAPAYLQGLRFAALKNMALVQRHFLLRARAYGLVNRKDLHDWEKQFLLAATADHFKKILECWPAVTRIAIEAVSAVREFAALLAPPVGSYTIEEIATADLEKLPDRRDTFVLADRFETLAARVAAVPDINRGMQASLHDLVAALKVTKR